MSEEPKPKRITRPITFEERQHIEAFLKRGISPYRIARLIKRAQNTVVQEIKRNGGSHKYSAEKAHASLYIKHNVREFVDFSLVVKPETNFVSIEERLKTLEFAFQSLFEIVKELKQLNQKENP